MANGATNKENEMKMNDTAVRADRLRHWIAELEMCITSEYELSLAAAQEELAAL